MSNILKLRGDFITYRYEESTSQPSATFDGYVRFSSAISAMSVDNTYTLYISHENNIGGDVSKIIEKLDGVESKYDLPVKGGKSSIEIPSARCSFTNYQGTLIFDVLYNTETYN